MPEALLNPPKRHLQVTFLTGQSNPASCALSPDQHTFLARLQSPSLHVHSLNFPYRSDLAPHQPTPLVRASVANARQYLQSRQPGFAQMHRPPVLALLDAAPHTVFLAGSCGLELLVNLALPAQRLQHISVFAFGPVARRVPACTLLSLRGRSDWVSRLYSGPTDHTIDHCGHMDYLRHPQVLALCQQFIEQQLSAVTTQEA